MPCIIYYKVCFMVNAVDPLTVHMMYIFIFKVINLNHRIIVTYSMKQLMNCRINILDNIN